MSSQPLPGLFFTPHTLQAMERSTVMKLPPLPVSLIALAWYNENER